MIAFNVKVTGKLKDKSWVKDYKALIAREMKRNLLIVEREVERNTPVGVAGALRAGVTSKLVAWNHGRVAVAGPATKYAEIREKGRRPGRFPPPDAIALWLKRTDRGRAYVAAIAAKYKIKNAASALKQAAFLKARAIARQGYKGAFMFREAERRTKARVIANFKSALARWRARL